MTKPGYVIGIIITVISGAAFLLMFMALVIYGEATETLFRYMFYSIIGIVIGVITLSNNTTSNAERQEYEDFKRARQQQTAYYYRYANAKGKPIEEYTMDPRTKLMVYYDRMPSKYQQQLVDKADQLYRKFENEQYTQK